MQKYTDLVLGLNGQTLVPVVGASVTVLTYPGGANATIYSDNGITPTANPLTTDNTGRFSFYAANGRYSLLVTYQTVSYSIQDIPLLDDPANGQTTVITGGSIDNTPIGATTPSTGAFTNLSATGTLTGFPGRLLNIQVFTANGTYTNTAGTNSVIVEVQAPGGGSGGCAATGASQSASASGGGAGAYAKVRLTSGFTGGIAITCPAGGAGGAAGANNGSNASSASFGAIISCPGGMGGLGGTATSAAFITAASTITAAPTISSGTTLLSVAGSAGSVGMVLTPGSLAVSGFGGTSMLGFGGRQVAGGNTPGQSGTGFGSGASGSNTANASQAAIAGTAGQGGIITVYEFA